MTSATPQITTALAAAFGAEGRSADRAEEIGPAIRDAVAAGGVQLVHIPQHRMHARSTDVRSAP